MNDFRRLEQLAKQYKALYPKGTRIELETMGSDLRPIEPGTRGTVDHVDDLSTIHCTFDNGRRLGIIPEEDSFRKPTRDDTYDFSVSDLSLSPSVLYQGEYVSVSFVSDNWNKDLAYEDVPVEVLVDDKVVKTECVDFAAYGRNQHRYSICLSDIGYRTIKVRINWGNRFSESNTYNNSVISGVEVLKYYEFSVSDLQVNPTVCYAGETISVSFRTDSWDGHNAYESIPVELLYNGEEYMTGEELYQYLHVSKRKMKYLLENGYIPCINTGKRTHRYIVSRADARAFRERMQNDPTVKEELRGRFSSEHSATFSFQVTEEFCKRFATHLREIWRDEPEALPAVRVAELVGMHRGRIYTLCEQGKLFCITVGDRRICGKESVIAYFSSREVLRKPNATAVLGELVKEFRERVKHT